MSSYPLSSLSLDRNLLASSGTSSSTLRYTGREHDSLSGLYYYRARYYDPEIGRFLSEDPSGFGGGDLNLFAFVGNNPLSASDPSGRCAILCTAAVGGAIGAVTGGMTAHVSSRGTATWSEIGTAAAIGGLTGVAVGSGLGWAVETLAIGAGSATGSQVTASAVAFSGTLASGAVAGYASSVMSQVSDSGSFYEVDYQAARGAAVLGAVAAFLPATLAAGAQFYPVSYSTGQEVLTAMAMGSYEVAAGSALDLFFADSITPNPYYRTDYPSSAVTSEFGPTFLQPSSRAYRKP